MYPWNSCRTCLSLKQLQPLFDDPEKCEEFTNSVFSAVGIKIEARDNINQYMCKPCLKFIDEINKFRKKAEESLKVFDSQIKNNHSKDNIESVLKSEPVAQIDDEDNGSNEFNDYDDNITLDNFQYRVNVEKVEENTEEYETTVGDIVDKPIDIIFNTNSPNKKVANVKPTKPKKRKKENTEQNNKREKKKGAPVKEQIECEYCHKILTSKLSLRNHYKIHTGFDVVCEHCGKKFITRRLLLMHCRAKHGYEKTDKCSYCDYKASNAEQVKIHERLHTGEKPYVCKDCGTGFHRRSSYLQHVAIHLPEKTVQCDLCPSLFKSVTLMRIHRSRHRAAQPTFRCAVCGGSFARRRNVARHLQRAHRLPPDAQHIHRVESSSK